MTRSETLVPAAGRQLEQRADSNRRPKAIRPFPEEAALDEQLNSARILRKVIEAALAAGPG